VTDGTVRVGIDLTPLLGQRSGIGAFTSELVGQLAGVAELAAAVHLVGYAVTWRGRSALAGLAPPGVRVVERPLPARPLRWAWSRLDHPVLERFIGPIDVVHGTNFVVPPTRRAARLVTVHDLTPVRFPELSNRDTLAYPRLIERAWRSGAWVHADSEFVADEVREWLRVRDADAHRVVPIHLGVTPQAAGRAAAGRALAGAERYVLAVGTIEPRKGLVDLVRAFDLLAARDDPGRSDAERVRLVVAGADGWALAAFVAAVAASDQRARIVRLGRVDDAQRADLMAGAAVLAYPSLYEGFGLPPLEAMSAGVPVVCSDAGPLPEVTGNAAVRVPAGCPEALAAALADVLGNDALRARLADAGPAHAAGFSWRRCAEALCRLYQRMAS
jgi:glycosyltransferase involved in cell wall biosynthesis